MGTVSFKTFLLGLVVGAAGGYGVGRWLPLDSAITTSSPPAVSSPATPPPLAPDQLGALPAKHPPLVPGGDATESPAVAAARRTADTDIGNYLAQMDAAAALYQAGRFADSLAYAQRARNLRPDSVDALLAIGVSQAELGQYDAAVKTLEQAAARRPTDADTQTELAYVHLRRKAFREALATAEQAARQAGYSERALEIIAQAALALGEPARARAAVERLAAVNPGNPRLAELTRSLAPDKTTPDKTPDKTTKGKPS